MNCRRIFKAVEIFAGGGGLAVGLRRARFSTVAAIECEPHAAATFKANHPATEVICQDVQEIAGRDLLPLAGGQVDVLAACPPCQGFSSLTTKYHRQDSRNALVMEVGRMARELRPKAIMMENVPGLSGRGRSILDCLIGTLEASGYAVNWSVLQVADYGVPQSRRRLVLLAGRGFLIDMPSATHSRLGTGGLPKWKTVGETIEGMPKPVPFVEARSKGGAHLFNWHVVRRLSSENQERLRLAQPGGSRLDLPVEKRPPCHARRSAGFQNIYGRMQWDKPSPTITAGCTTLSKGRFGHPEESRTISLREAALLQTFPKEYRFDTPYFERACEIVGNALPCTFAEAIACQVRRALVENAV